MFCSFFEKGVPWDVCFSDVAPNMLLKHTIGG